MTRLRGLSMIAMALLGALPAGARAQADSARIAVADTARPPIIPRRAALYSFIAPGLGQSILGRHRVAAGLLVVEAMSIAMIVQSNAEIREARRAAGDSIVLSYVGPNGEALSTPLRVRPPFDSTDVRTRRGHREDWIALLVANHLFAAAEAFVAAHLWDVPVRLSIRSAPGGGTVVAARLRR